MCRSQHLVDSPCCVQTTPVFLWETRILPALGTQGVRGGEAASTGVLCSVWFRGSLSHTGENWMLPCGLLFIYLFIYF